MRYELMLPYQIREAIAGNWPVVLPLGVLEYHGEHLAVGMDTLAVTRVLERLEREADLIVLPPFYYGAASYAVAGAKGNGTLDVPADRLFPFAQSLFASLLKVGFRNIHGFIHHQTENFAAGMPTDLAFKFAARQAIFAFLEAERGEGWWGDAAMADYYAKQADKADPFNWIQVHPLLNAEAIQQFPFDHAGEGETSLMLDLCPEGVDMSRFSAKQWFTRTAKQASAATGRRGSNLILAHMRAMMGLEARDQKKAAALRKKAPARKKKSTK
jgi:creatinine amidohydrolase